MCLLTAALALLASPGLTPPVAAQPTFVVDDNSPSCAGNPPDHPTITAALAAAVDGDTIWVCAGNYTEQPVITHSVTITGPGATSIP